MSNTSGNNPFMNNTNQFYSNTSSSNAKKFGQPLHISNLAFGGGFDEKNKAFSKPGVYNTNMSGL
jgi:hypothetical protein